MAKRTIFETAVLIAAILIPAHVLSAQQTADPRIALKVVDYAKVDRKTFEAAKHVVLRVLARAGIKILLLDPDVAASTPKGRVTLYVNVSQQVEFSGLPANALGVAPGTVDERTRCVVYVFDHTASRLVEQVNALDKSATDRGTILGYAMAHEIGHILLHLIGHSPSGVMKAKWSVEDMRAMSSGRLNFHPTQAAKMQAEVRRRMRDQQTSLGLIASGERQAGATAK